MKFSEWFKKIEEATGLITDPYEAMEELNLVDLSGKVLDQDSLNRAYRKMQMAYHPDVQGGNEEKSKRINSAKEVLDSFVGKNLPSSMGSQPEPVYRSSSSSYNPEPRSRNNYSTNDIQQWAENIVSKNYLQFVLRELLRWLPMDAVFSGFTRAIGSKTRTEKLNKKGRSVTPEDILEIVKLHMSHDGANFPQDIYHMDLNERWGEAWVTYKSSKGYRSLSFNVLKEPVKKQAGVGMKIDQVESYLLANDANLRRLGGGYLGYPEHMDGRTFIGVMVKLQPKVLNIVKRYRSKMYGQSKVEEIKLTSGSPYGLITPEYLNKIISFIQKRRGQKDENV